MDYRKSRNRRRIKLVCTILTIIYFTTTINIRVVEGNEGLGEKIDQLETNPKQGDDLFNWEVELEERVSKEEKMHLDMREIRKGIIENREEIFGDGIQKMFIVTYDEMESSSGQMAWAMLKEAEKKYKEYKANLDININTLMEYIDDLEEWVKRVHTDGTQKDIEKIDQAYGDFNTHFNEDLLLITGKLIEDVEKGVASIRVSTDSQETLAILDEKQTIPMFKEPIKIEIAERREIAQGNFLIRLVNIMENRGLDFDKGYLYQTFEDNSGVRLQFRPILNYETDEDVESERYHKLVVGGLWAFLMFTPIIPDGSENSLATKLWRTDKSGNKSKEIIKESTTGADYGEQVGEENQSEKESYRSKEGDLKEETNQSKIKPEEPIYDIEGLNIDWRDEVLENINRIKDREVN